MTLSNAQIYPLASLRGKQCGVCRFRVQVDKGNALLDGAGGDQADWARQAGRHLVSGVHRH